ncbi:ABC transporter ATP-binding protein [Rhizohabitans arisaemae]|uniref:ABC transporter ATP-binding protein n=1 Tax=Rhizohabitans arisaemae TaxID=2720610 RepID=UPI0024B15EC8|nr:ABC transporter ATP-binding protein [Rhizohabitans arisaemae]
MLVARNITKRFGAVEVLRGVGLTVSDGAFAAVLGPSGCGKTTLLRIVAGFERADSGSVSIGGRSVGDLPPERRKVGIVPQEAALFPHLTVSRNVGYGLPRGSRERIEEMLGLVGLAGFGDRMPHELSGGQQQRVALARALAPGPGVVLLDEPFSALDRGLRSVVRDDVRDVLKRAGATAVLVTHDQEEALSMADEVAVMREGRIVQVGTPAAVYGTPADLRVATFVGEAVVLPASASGGAADCALGRIPVRTGAVAGNGGTSPAAGHVALRPEQFRLGHPGDDRLRGRVERVEFFGHDAVVTVRLPQMPAPVRARTAGEAPYHPGDEVGVHVEGAALFYREG